MGEYLGYYQNCFSKSNESQLSLPTDFSRAIHEFLIKINLKSPSPWNKTVVLDSIGDSPQSISDCVLQLVNGVLIWSLEENGAALGVLASFNKSEFILSKSLLVDALGESELFPPKLLNRIHCDSAASKH